MYRLLVLLLAVSEAVSAAYVFPEIYLQARRAGGLRAFLPDSCGVDKFGMKMKKKNDSQWMIWNGTKEEDWWSWDEPLVQAGIGDVFDYTGQVWYRGLLYSSPVQQWTVPELVDIYEPPPLPEMKQECDSSELAEDDLDLPQKTKSTVSPKTTPRTPRKKTPTTTIKTTPNTTPGMSTKETDPPTNPTTEEYNSPIRQPKGGCSWLEPPKPGMTKEELLERQLSVMQCEMSAFLERTTKLTAELNQELLDLKKLNYATVVRMQRLESLLRTIPRAVPYPYL